MERLVFTGPEACETLFDPTPEQMAAILRRGPAYWGWNSGDALLQWCLDDRASGLGWEGLPADERPQLSVLYNEVHGFHLAYSGPDQFLVPFDPTAPNLRVLHFVGGNRAFFPQASFVHLEVAVRIVCDFLASGIPSPAVEWRSGSELRCGDPLG